MVGLSDFWAASIAAADGFRIVAVDGNRVPARGLETHVLVGRIRDRDRAVDRDVVVVPEDDQLVELQVAGKRDGFLADAFHEAAVADDRIGVVILQVGTEFVSQLAFGNRHADGIGNALAERAGGGLDAGGMAIFRVAGGLGSRAGGNS